MVHTLETAPVTTRREPRTQVLRLSDDLALPASAVTQTITFLARKGAGKTYAASKLAEEMLGVEMQVVVIDPVGVWYGLRLAADGTSPGIPVPVLGGSYGDIPLEHEAGALIADLVVDSGTSLVLDVSTMHKGERIEFVTAFAERLFFRKKTHRSPMHLFLEEAQVFAPQQVWRGAERQLGAVEDIVRLGRNFGIGCSLISQRPQSINKEVLNQAEMLVVMQMSGEHERKAIRGWIVEHGIDTRAALDDLPSLPVGTAYVWSPSWLRFFDKVRIAPKWTYNASATPEFGEHHAPRSLEPLDLDAISAAMRDLVMQSEQNDPKLLRIRVAELETQIADLRAQLNAKTAPERIVETVEVPVIRTEDLEHFGLHLQRQMAQWSDRIELWLADHTHHDGTVVPATPRLPMPESRPATVVEAPPKIAQAATDDDERPLSKGEQSILDTLLAFEMLRVPDVERENVAVFAGQSPRSSAYGNKVSQLREHGYIEFPSGGRLRLTRKGREHARTQIRITTVADLHAAWYRFLPSAQEKILRQLISIYPKMAQRDALARLAGVSATSSAYSNTIARLFSLGLVVYPQPGYVAASAMLFPVEK